MDSSAVYESGNDSDSGSCWSEDEEQVIEISSHSRILISPRRTRSSAWDDNPWCESRESVSADKRNATCSRRIKDRAGKRRLISSPEHRFGPGHVPDRSRTKGNQRTSPSRKQSSTDNNHSESSESEGDSDSIASSGHDASGHSDNDTDGSFQKTFKKPTRRSSPRMHHSKKVTKSSRSFIPADPLADSMQSFGAPTTAGREMDELKATLEKLARHDEYDGDPAGLKSSDITSTAALREYLTAAAALRAERGMKIAEQIRPNDFTGVKAAGRHSSFPPTRSSLSMATPPMRANSKSERTNNNDVGSNQDDHRVTSVGATPTGNERSDLTKKSPSVPHSQPRGASAGLTGGSAFPFQTSKVNGGGAQGSRAMLSALKALQDKIGRLEEEREALKQELSDTKLVARKREAELASSEKKFSYELGQTKESARAAYDALRCDREELNLQLVKSEERRKAMQAELHHSQELTKTLSDKADDLQSQLQTSESHRIRVKTEMKETDNNNKRIIHEMQTELAQVKQELQSAVERNELLEAQFQREASNSAESRERLRESEQTVASLSQLNEKLVAKVWEATEAANEATKKHNKLLQQQRPSTLLRSTAASRASAAAVTEATARRRGTATSASSQGSTGVSPARTHKKKKTASASDSTTKKKQKQARSSNMTLLREANLGKEIPFLLGNSVQPSFSLIGNVQDALRRCDTTYLMPNLHGVPATPESASSYRKETKTSHTATQSGDEANSPEGATNVQPPPAIQVPMTTAENAPILQTPKSSAGSHRRSKKPPAIKVPPIASYTYASPMQNQIMHDLGTAVEAAENEFKTLNERYKCLVAQMEANNRHNTRGSKKSKTDSSSTSNQLSQALGPLLDELDAKAKQLNLLKQVYQQAANSTINPPRHVVLSPEAIRRKTASLRLLHEYRQLESDAKNKGSGRSASPAEGSFIPFDT